MAAASKGGSFPGKLKASEVAAANDVDPAFVAEAALDDEATAAADFEEIVVTLVSLSEAEDDLGGGDMVADDDMALDELFFRPSCPKNCIPPDMMFPMLRLIPNIGD